MIITNSMLFDEEYEGKNNVNILNYYKIILNIEDSIPINGNHIINIEFDNTEKIQFIHPLFLVYLLNFYEKLQIDNKYSSRDIRIILNIEKLDSNVQSYILTYFTQYIDCKIIYIVNSKSKEREENPLRFTDKKILLYTTEEENNLTLLKKQPYKFLPIIKIANNTFNENFEDKDYWRTDNTGKREKISRFDRKIFYKSLQLDAKESIYKKTRNTIWTDIFETYLELTKNGAYITEKFKGIFSEIVGNIQKHTKIDDTLANGYISFYIDSSKQLGDNNDKLYELIVSDDYQKGFLSKYYETIFNEILKEKQDSIAWNDYKNIIQDFDNGEYQKVLENIFNLRYVLSSQSERMTKHFGMPLLLRIVNQFSKISEEKYGNNSFVNLEIYLNKEELSFFIKYKNGKATVQQLPNNVVRGTYIYLSFPQNLTLENPVISTKQPLKLASKYYKELLEDKKQILEKHLNNFQYYVDLKNTQNLSNKINAIVVDYTNIEETSDFLRDLYSFAFLNSVQDILVVNYPIEDNIDYLKILSETTDLSKICNIAFLNKEYPQVLFLGGASPQEMYDINTMLSQTYNYNKRNFLETFQEQGSVNLISNLFYKNYQSKQIFFPFELFLPNPTNKNELLYTLMLDNFLELKENHEDIHLDLKLKKDNLHIKKFYYLKYVFENSQWVKLMSFDLAKKIKNKYLDFKDIVFVGIEKYSSSFIAELEYLLDTKLQSYIVNDLNNTSIIEQFDNFKNINISKTFIFIRPSVFESNIDTLTQDLNTYVKYTLVLLTKDGIDSNQWIATYSKNLQNVLERASSCIVCLPISGVDQPLYEIAKDKYNIKDLYHTHDTYTKNDKFFKVSWEETIYFPHISRNTNDYLYYIRTTQFLRNNKDDIKNYFEQDIDFKRDNKIPVILTSAHNTNAEFVALINEIVFENDAIVHSLSLNNKEQGYFSIENLTSTYQKKEKYYNFYFVDDAISSGEAFKYIYSVLSSFFEDKFQAVFTLIDRTNEKDLNLMSSFYEDNSFYSYLKINIHPIKTGFEDCYLCERKKTFEKIAFNSSLVTIKHTFQEKANDLAKKNACEIEYELLEPITDLKNYLRMSSTEYIYQYIDEFNTIEDIDTQFQEYYKLVQNYFSIFYFDKKQVTAEINKFLKIESKIAFLKSLAFPKVYFFKTLRENIHTYIYKEIRKFTDINQGAKEIIIQPLLNEYDTKLLEKYDLGKLVKYYTDKKRTNMNYFSFLLSLSSYLGINHILSYEVIMYYYNLTLEIKKEENYNYRNLLNAYPIAVKQLTSYSQEKSKHFERELWKFYEDCPFEYTRIFSRIFGLFVENTTHLRIDENIFQNINKEQSIDQKTITFKNELEKIISIDIKSICIDLNENIDNPLLVDILNKYQEVDKKSIEEIMYRSAFVKTDINDKDIVIEYRKEEDDNKKYNIWCNYYKDFKTYIRITRSNDKLTPIGVIVIEHTNNNNLNEHLKISRLILAYQNIIDKLFQDYNILSAMRSKYDELVEQKRKENQNLRFLIQKSSHGAIQNIRESIKNFNDKKLSLLDSWIAYSNLVIGRMYMLGTEQYDQIIKQKSFKEIENTEIDELFELYRYSYQGFDFVYNIDYDLMNNLDIDPTHLKVFFILLLSNSVKYSNEESKILISLQNNNLEIINENVSKNISPDTIKNILTTNPVDLMQNNDIPNISFGITLYTMNQFLLKFNYKMDIDFIDKKFIVKIAFKDQK